MSGFEFSNTPSVEIGGKKYLIELGDPQVQKQLMEVGLEIASMEITPDVFDDVHEKIHAFLRALLSEKDYKEIFNGKKDDIIDDLRLMAYIQETISEMAAISDLMARLGRFAPQVTK